MRSPQTVHHTSQKDAEGQCRPHGRSNRSFLTTALGLFSNTIALIVTCGVRVVCKNFTLKNFEPVNPVKVLFVKKTLGLHKTTGNCFEQPLNDSLLLSKGLHPRFRLLIIEASKSNSLRPNFASDEANSFSSLRGLNETHVLHTKNVLYIQFDFGLWC